jgi:hypothetical protein
MSELTFFPVDGYWYAGETPDPKGTSSAPRILVVRGLVDFFPRVPVGFSIFINDLDVHGDGTLVVDTSLSFPPRTARIWNGRLSTINVEDTPTIELLSETADLGLDADILPDTDGHIIYDVRFRDIVFNGVPQKLSNFGFQASTDASPIVLTDPELERLPYGGPSPGNRP